MGSGKSTLGRKLARELGYDFYDSDQEIEQATGVAISWIFDTEGESGFRQRESDQLRRLLQRDNCVIATGGGVILSAANRELLRQHSMVVYLQIDIDEQLRRVNHCRNRPLLAGSAGKSAIDLQERRQILLQLQSQREALYRQTAHHCLAGADTKTLVALAQAWQK